MSERTSSLSGASLSAPLAGHTSLRVGGAARYYLESRHDGLLAQALIEAAATGVEILVLGGGSNLLVADGGFNGLAMKYTADDYTVMPGAGETGMVSAAAGVTIAGLARRLAREGWSGLEWASNVPGNVGGAAVNNAGAFGSSMAESLIGIDLLDPHGTAHELANADMKYVYRSSALKRGELGAVLVTKVRCRLRKEDPAVVRARVADFQARRTATQPRQLSAGSVFANPSEDFAGRLLETAGLKGAEAGGAEISRQHANFIVNVGKATASDVYQLIRLAQDTVWDKFKVWLRPEIQLVGSWQPEQLRALAEPPSDATPTLRTAGGVPAPTAVRPA